MASIEEIKKLREETGISLMECRKALEKSGDDIEKARDILRTWGKEVAKKKGAERTAGQGLIESYIHPNKKIGVLLSIRCESDFVAMSDNFKNLSHEICLQVAASNPMFVRREDISAEVLEKEKEIYKEQMKDSGKSQQILEQITEGKLRKYEEQNCLLLQPWIKEPDKKVEDLVNEYISKIGEKIVIEKFTRYEL